MFHCNCHIIIVCRTVNLVVIMIIFILIQYDMDTGVLTITGNATTDVYEQVLANLTYFNKYANQCVCIIHLINTCVLFAA